MKRLMATMALATLLAGCGGSGDGGNGDDGAVTSNGVSIGVITGFGSLITNDDRFETDDAEVFRGDDRVNDVTELEIGMRVRIEGDMERAIASRVSFEEDVKGPVDSVNPLRVMGQTIETDDGTHVRQSGGGMLEVGDLGPGDILEISGTRLDNDHLLATFIERKDNPVNKYKVIGAARNVDPNAMTLEIGGLNGAGRLLVRYGTADVDDDFVGGQPISGQLVEVHQEPPAYLAGDMILDASKIEPVDELEGAVAGNRIEIQSIVVNADNAPASFVLHGGLIVHTSATTTYRYGTAADIAVNSALQVKGTRREDGGIDATRIKFRDNAVRMEAFVKDVPATDPMLDARTIRVLDDVLVKIPATAEMDDNGPDPRAEPFEFDDIADNDYLEIRGFIGANGMFIATEVKREEADGDVDVSVRAIVTAANAELRTVELLGTMISADDSTQYEGVSGSSHDATGFFSRIEVGVSTVEAEWRLEEPVDPDSFNPGMPVRTLEFEDDDD